MAFGGFWRGVKHLEASSWTMSVHFSQLSLCLRPKKNLQTESQLRSAYLQNTTILERPEWYSINQIYDQTGANNGRTASAPSWKISKTFFLTALDISRNSRRNSTPISGFCYPPKVEFGGPNVLSPECRTPVRLSACSTEILEVAVVVSATLAKLPNYIGWCPLSVKSRFHDSFHRGIYGGGGVGCYSGSFS